MSVLTCGVAVQVDDRETFLGRDADGAFYTFHKAACTSCDRFILRLNEGTDASWFDGPGGTFAGMKVRRTWLVRPFGSSLRRIPAEVPPGNIREDYSEAALTLNLSPKASAALGRTCLQNVIREKLGIKQRTLYDEIEEVLTTGSVPGYLGDQLHNVREIGNNAAHPITTGATGDIVDVEPHEAEWTLDVLDGLFDFLYVAPAKAAARQAALDAKMGRP